MIKWIKENNFKLVIVTLDDMSTVIYANNSRINVNNSIDNIDYLGILGFAYKYDMELQWFKVSNDKYAVLAHRDLIKDFILHHTLDKNSKDYNSNILRLKEVIKDG